LIFPTGACVKPQPRVSVLLMLAYGFARRGQPFVAATWLWRTVKCRRGGFAQVCTFLLRRLARLRRTFSRAW
jgi:hypothetical protein